MSDRKHLTDEQREKLLREWRKVGTDRSALYDELRRLQEKRS